MQTLANQWQLFWNGLTGLLGRILGSRKMLLGIISLALIIVTNLAPELSAKAEQIGNLIFAVSSMAIFGIALEDSLTAFANRPKTAEEALASVTAELQTTTGASNTVNPVITNTPPPAALPPEDVAKGAA